MTVRWQVSFTVSERQAPAVDRGPFRTGGAMWRRVRVHIMMLFNGEHFPGRRQESELYALRTEESRNQ